MERKTNINIDRFVDEKNYRYIPGKLFATRKDVL